MQGDTAQGRKGAGSRPRWWAHFTNATRIAREREPICGLRLEMTLSPEEDEAAVQFRVSDLVHGAIALAGGPPTTPDWTVVDAESALREGDALQWTALHMPIPDHTALDDETLAHAVAIAGALAAMDDGTGQTVQGPASGLTGEPIAVAREIPEHDTFVVRAHRREWEAVLGEATDWTRFEGNTRIVERNLLAHSRRWVARQLDGSGYGMAKAETVITLLRSEGPARDNDLAWLFVPDRSGKPPRETIDELLSRLTRANGAAGQQA